MKRLLKFSALLACAALLLASLSACAVYHTPPDHQYGYVRTVPVYVEPAPVIVVPPFIWGFGFGYWWGHGWHHHGR